MPTWVKVCAADELADDDVMPFNLDDREFAIYRTIDGEFFASDGRCTHQGTLLCDGLVMDDVIECPKHNGRFSLRDGRALGAPVLVDLTMYSLKVEDGIVYLDVGA
jgi:3-phenylpropionate/trans-cinnamate dioxygenase ferredoxin subunit